MKVVVSKSPVSDWDHGSSNFLLGVAAELEDRGHQVDALEPPGRSQPTLEAFDLDAALEDADLVLVPADTDPALIARIGAHRAGHNGYRLLLHDTPQGRTAPEEVGQLDLSNYDGVLAASGAILAAHLGNGWSSRGWIWRDAVDTRVFHPLPTIEPECDVVWSGDWGATRSCDLAALLLRPARQLRLQGHVHSGDAPRSARLLVRLAGLHCSDALADAQISEAFARHRLTVDLPHPDRVAAAPGVPTSRALEALACGIPLISTPWEDSDELLQAERDHLIARDQAEMREAMQAIIELPEFAAELRERGLATVRASHTCAHRADELLAIDAELRGVTLELAG